jgi:hypothetical protein
MKFRLLRAFGLTAFVCAGAVCLAPAMAFASAGAAGATASSKASARGAVKVRAPVAGASAATGARATSITGAAWTSDNTPIPAARVRLRNVLSGKVEATTVANDMGQFAFTGIESGSYVIELVTDRGKLLSIGHTFTVGPGETVATFIRLGTKVPWFNGFFQNTSSAVAAAAASMGVTAVAPEKRTCVSACTGQ